jgi:acyl carrier protein
LPECFYSVNVPVGYTHAQVRGIGPGEAGCLGAVLIDRPGIHASWRSSPVTGRPRGPGGPTATHRHDPKIRRGDTVPAETHVAEGPLDRSQVLDLIRDLLADILEIEPTVITESSSFAEDLDADSLALIELVEGLEEELGERSVGFRIDDEDLEELRTVRDAVDYVYAKLGGA